NATGGKSRGCLFLPPSISCCLRAFLPVGFPVPAGLRRMRRWNSGTTSRRKEVPDEIDRGHAAAGGGAVGGDGSAGIRGEIVRRSSSVGGGARCGIGRGTAAPAVRLREKGGSAAESPVAAGPEMGRAFAAAVDVAGAVVGEDLGEGAIARGGRADRRLGVD